jgi:hypothetical protein
MGWGRFEKIEASAAYDRLPPFACVLLRKTLCYKNIRGDFRGQSPIDKPSLTIINPRSSIPKPPANLGPAGATLWRSIMSEYAIDDAGGRALLEQAATAYDRAEQLRIEIERDGEIIRSRSGVERPSHGARGPSQSSISCARVSLPRRWRRTNFRLVVMMRPIPAV